MNMVLQFRMLTSLRRGLLIALWLGCGGSVPAGISVQRSDDDHCRITWNDHEIVSSFSPHLRRLGGGTREWYDPNSRQYSTVVVPPSQDGFLTIYNGKREKVLLGAPVVTVEEQDGGVRFRHNYPAASVTWQVSIMAVGDNGFDVSVAIESTPQYWIGVFDIRLLVLNLNRALCDSGHIANWQRPSKSLDGVGPLRGDIRIVYPNGPNSFVPVGVMQDDQVALGVCLLGAHTSLLQDCSELSITPENDNALYRVGLRSSENPFYGRMYQHEFNKRYRFRCGPPIDIAPRGYLSLLDAKDLWKDYMAELEAHVPVMPAPPRDPSKNNIILMNFFMAEQHLVTEANPMGWLMNDPNWKDNPWEWTVTPDMDEETVRKTTGFGPENFGKPVQWIKAYADKCVRDLEAGNCLAMITWGSGIVSDPYAPESHLFNPELEETLPVDDAVRAWDWVEADIVVRDSVGEVIARRQGTRIRAYNPEEILHLEQAARAQGPEQRLKLETPDIKSAGVKYLPSAGGRSNKDRLVDNVALVLKVKTPRDKLVGLKPGAAAALDGSVVSNDRAQANEAIVIEATVTAVHRSAIDVWAQTLIDAGQEFGFLVREDFTVGMPWQQWCQRFDWSSEWQYTMLKQRFQWHRARFGEHCRWFYLDVFGNYTPQFVFDRLRNDFPDCFFFVEHPNDAVLRTVQAWNWDGPMTELERYVAPDGLVTVLPERIFSAQWAWSRGAFTEKDRTVMQQLWRDPRCIFVTHREVRGLVRRATESGCETGIAPAVVAPANDTVGALNADGSLNESGTSR